MKRLRPVAIGLVLVVSLSWRASLAAGIEGKTSWPTDAPSVPPQVRQSMQDRNYPEAVRAIDAALGDRDAPRDYLTYLRGQALALQGRYDAAAATFDAMQKDFPKSDWLRRARLAKAVALARKGDFRAAELIVRAEAAHLLSADRKQQLADIYLEFADALFKPLKEDQQPDYAKALEFYQKALETGPKPARRIEVELRSAQCLQNLDKFGEAVALYEKFLKDHPGDGHEIEAMFRLGECRWTNNELNLARRVWQDLLAKSGDAKSERIAEAQFQLAHTWNIPKPESDEELNLGVSAHRAFLERFPTHKLAAAAHLEIALSYVARDRHEDAAAALRRFLDDPRYRDREEIPAARNLLGSCHQHQKKYAEAIAVWREYLVKHPTDKHWSAVQEEIIDAEYAVAVEKLAAKQYDAANKLFAEFVAKYPLDDRVRAALLLMNQKACAEKKWAEAIAAWRRIVSKYPDLDEAAQAQFLIAETLETKLGKLDDALEEYRKTTRGDWGQRAALAAARLTAVGMAVATERVFRSHETPQLKLTTRNVESVTVRAYKVDMETYFRKMHLARGVEGLDIALIAPDRTFEFKVPGYAKHKLLESRIDVPLPGGARSGVMAVTISGKTLEATTLVIQSDLDVIVKSSRDEVFVFAENMRTGKPWPGARLLISNGRQVFAEAATGPDGVLQKAYKELKDADDVRVFAAAGGNVASNVVDLEGVRVAQGLADKGYIYTDRPAYRPGEVVHLRGCVRRAAGDVYTVEQGKKFTLDVLDPRDRLLWRETVKLGRFGTFAASFTLPADSPQERYRVVLHDDAGKTYVGDFRIHREQLDTVRLEIDAPRRVYYRGQEIEGVIRATYYYGAPLAGREVHYQLADDRQYTATTDARGEVRFKLPTREYNETQSLALHAVLPERNLHAAANYLLSVQEFSIDVATVRPVYVAGETFEMTLNTLDAEGKPTAQQLTLRVLEQTVVNGEVGERLVEERRTATGTDGTARTTLKLAKGGRYVVRAEAIDRFHNAVSGQCGVRISGDEDQVRLRILADRHTFHAGENAEIKLHWRERPSLALVTFQGARVLDYRLVALHEGMNTLVAPMTAKLAPNFDLSVAVMTEGREARDEGRGNVKRRDLPRADAAADRPIVRFHEATAPFSVDRGLCVKIAVRPKNSDAKNPAGAPVRPGEPIEVTVTTTDPQGRPVAAEVSLAMVEQSLLDRFGSNAAAIDEFFRGRRRAPAVRTTSSIAFAYAPATRPINPRLLAEEDRQAAAADEKAARLQVAVALGRESQSLTMMVTPRIVIQGEEEEPLCMAGQMRKTPQRAGNLTLTIEQSQRMVRQGRHAGKAETSPMASLAALDAQLEGRNCLEYRDYRVLFRQWPEADTAAAVLSETAYWNPSITTGNDGKATVTFTVPERSTAWRLLAKGITTDTLAGQSDAPLAVRKQLFGQLRLPASFTDGDRAEVIASIHNNTVEKGPIEVVLKTTIGQKSVEERKTVNFDAKGIREVSFAVDLRDRSAIDAARVGVREAAGLAPRVAPRESVAFDLTISAGNHRDATHRIVPIAPYGAPVYAAASGLSTSDTTAWVEPPKAMTLERPTLSILVGPSVEQSLLDVLFAPAPRCQCDAARIASRLETATSDLMAALGLQRISGAVGAPAAPQSQELDARIRSCISQLMVLQSDGGWSWSGGGNADCAATARALWALGLARKAGYNVPDDQFHAAVHFVRGKISDLSENDYQGRAVLLHALSAAGEGDFALANRLHRERQQLSPAALAYLALALAEMGRQPMAAELLDLLAKREDPDSHVGETGTLPWSGSPTELHALWALALEQVAPQSPKTKQQVDWLLAHRTGHRWSPEKATGPAALALCRWFAASRFDGQRYTLKVFVNDVLAGALDVDPARGTQTIDVPPAMLKPEGRQRINFQIAGRGRYAYQCILSGFVPAEKLQSTTKDWSITRTYEPAPLEMDGREVPRGFGMVREPMKPFKNPLTQLPVGQRGLVELQLHRKTAAHNVPADQLEYLVVTEPIPAGATVVEQSVTGGFDRFELAPGAITFYVGNRRAIEPICYEVYGNLPGEYRAAPTVVRNAYRPEQMAAAEPKSLSVPPAGANSADAYRLSPAELLAIGRRAFERGDMKTAGEKLAELMRDWNLDSDAYKTAVQTLLDVYLELGPPAQVVRYFEIVKEKWPNEEIPFAKIMKVGAAYHEMGEYERSYLVYRATVEGTFGRECGVAGFLEAQGQFTRSVDVLSRLLREYPPESYVADATYALAQHVAAKAESATPAEKLNRVELQHRAWSMLEGFLTAFPDDPAADQASLAAAGVLLDLKAYGKASAACDRYARRFPKSQLLDAYWYIIGYSHFALGEHEAAVEMCRKVADAKRIDPATGRQEDCGNKWQAVYILGQVYHSLGKPLEAIREYRRVEDRFADAKEAIAYFQRKAIELPEVVTFKPGEPVEVELKFRNVAACDLKVYRIDLMKFGLLKRNLGGIAQINLAGIRPLHQAAVALGDGKDYRDRTRKLSLPLKEEGAYLLVCRGDDLHASGLALVTPLAVEVQTDAVSGRVRTTVKDRTADKYLRDVQVKVIGGGNEDFTSGQTDLRGVFVADGIRGAVTVMAQAGPSRYAFYRAKEAAAPPIQVIAANQPPRAEGHREILRAVPFEESPAMAKIEAALQQPTHFDFADTPLRDVVAHLIELHKIEIQLDRKALQDVNIQPEQPVTKKLAGISLKSGLRLLLKDLSLTYLIRDGMLIITTPEMAESEENLITRVYPVGDLVLPAGAADGAEADFDSLIETIMGVRPQSSWEEFGGQGTIKEFPNGLCLVIDQTQEFHEKVAEMLAQLRKVKREQGKLPAVKIRPKPEGRGGPATGGAMGGMGGGSFGKPPANPQAAPSRAAAPQAGADLLQGVRGANTSNQSKQSGKLQEMYKGGRGGVSAGDAF
jgi:alpha-2-macroglobulin